MHDTKLFYKELRNFLVSVLCWQLQLLLKPLTNPLKWESWFSSFWTVSIKFLFSCCNALICSSLQEIKAFLFSLYFLTAILFLSRFSVSKFWHRGPFWHGGSVECKVSLVKEDDTVDTSATWNVVGVVSGTSCKIGGWASGFSSGLFSPRASFVTFARSKKSLKN